MSKHILRKHVHGFTVVSNNVIKVLKGNLPALGLYTYLLSLPDDWEFYKTALAKEFHIGIKKLDALLKELSGYGLVTCGQKRDDKGHFGQFYLDVYDTETIKNKDLEYEENLSTGQNQPYRQNCRTAKTVGRSGEATKEVLTKEELIKQNKNKSSSASRILKAENQKPKPEPTKIEPYDNEARHDWAPMANEKASIQRNEEFKRALPPPELRDMINKVKRRSMFM